VTTENVRFNPNYTLSSPPPDAGTHEIDTANAETHASVSYDTTTPPMQTYEGLDRAYQFFNSELFDGILPPCLITMQRSRKAYGYFSSNRFANIDNLDQVAHEIALNPAYFLKETQTRVLSTLVHEMVHLWQFHFGKAGRGRYHNLQWARKMESVGLMASATGLPGGKKTGDRVSHYILDDGPYARVCASYLANEETLLFQDRAYTAQAADEDAAIRERLQKAASKTRFSCPACGQNAWARRGAQLICAECDERMQ
jgi:predicted RNA-binding Zn-ribbon protein involved in translation (DUF1610 family)